MSNFDFDGKRIESRSEFESVSAPVKPDVAVAELLRACRHAHSSHATLIAELAAERAKVKKLREAAAKRLEDGHNDTCNHLLSPKSCACDCGHDELRAALAETAE